MQSRKACWSPGPGGAGGERRRGWILEDGEVVWTGPREMRGGGRKPQSSNMKSESMPSSWTVLEIR